MSASPIRGPRRCISSRRWTPCPRCAVCWPCSRAWPPAPPTATPGWPTNPPRCCCIWVRGWVTGWPTCTTRGARTCRWWSSSEITPPTTRSYDAPLESDIDALAGTVSGWVRRSARTADVGADAVDAITASRTGSVSTLILPADVSWTDGAQPAPALAPPVAPAVDDEAVRAAALALRSGEPTVILIGGDATRIAGSGRRGAGRRRHGCTGAVRDVPHPTRTRGGSARGGTAGLLRGGGAGPTGRCRVI